MLRWRWIWWLLTNLFTLHDSAGCNQWANGWVFQHWNYLSCCPVQLSNSRCTDWQFVSLFIFDYLPIRRIYLLFYTLLVATVGAVMMIKTISILSIPFAIIRMCCGVGLSAGCVIISQVVPVEFRALAFVTTDVFFSLAGAIVPATAAGMLV